MLFSHDQSGWILEFSCCCWWALDLLRWCTRQGPINRHPKATQMLKKMFSDISPNNDKNVYWYFSPPFSAVVCSHKQYQVPVPKPWGLKILPILKSTNQDLYDDFLNRVSYLKDVNFCFVISWNRCWDPRWFQCGSRSSILGQCESGSRSKVLMTKNWRKKITAKKLIFVIKNCPP